MGPRILEFAEELDTTLRQPLPKGKMDIFEGVLRALAEDLSRMFDCLKTKRGNYRV
jgi:hypothetical protein